MSAKNDINGKESSKRRQATRYLTATLIFCVTYFILLVVGWVIKIIWNIDVPLFAFPVQLVAVTGSIGTALLGVIVFEKPKGV